MVNRKERVLLSWSGGKDGALALQQFRQEGQIEVVGFLTTVVEEEHRVPYHEISAGIIEEQGIRAGVPVFLVRLPERCSDALYKEKMGKALDVARDMRIDAVAFGDLHLEEVRSFRETLLAEHGLAPRFPLWKRDTAQLSREIIDSGIRATVTSVDLNHLPEEFLGASYDRAFLDALPSGVDPCGENGEFHTVVHGGPFFRGSVNLSLLEPEARGTRLSRPARLRSGSIA